MTIAKFSIILFVLILVIIISLSISGVLNISFPEVFYFLLITAGIALVYIGIVNETSVIVFTGTGLFLTGVLFLTKTNFSVVLNSASVVPVVSSISAAGFLMVYICNPRKKYHLVISVLLFVFTVILLFTLTRFELTVFFNSILPFLKIYWPAIIIFIALIILLWKK